MKKTYVASGTLEKFAWFYGVLLALLLSHLPLYSQGIQSAASLAGHIVDESSAVVPGAKLVLLEKNRGAKYEGESNEAGYFVFPHVVLGTYELTVSKSGFADSVITPVHLTANQAANLSITMKVGQVAQQISIEASTLALETQTAETAQSLGPSTISAVPLNTRSPFALIALMPGVTSSFVSYGSNTGGTGASSRGGLNDWSRLDFNAVGAVQSTSQVLIDGANVKQNHVLGMGTPAVVPSPDFTQEFKFQSTNYGPEFGFGFGVVNVVTKSGTNQFHGVVYDYWQNSALQANDFFSNAHGQPRPFLNRHQWGGAVGGPVYIPKLYNGRNRTWFFFNFERLQQIQPFNVQTRVPTPDEVQGNFNNTYAADGTQITLYNPYDTYTGPNGEILRRPFANNTIPVSMRNQLGQFASNIAKYYPALNVPGGIRTATGLPTNENNFFKNYGAPYNYTRIDTKIDQQITPNQKLMFRLSLNPDNSPGVKIFGDTPATPSYGGPSQHNDIYWTSGQLSYTITPNPTLVINQFISMTRETYTQYYYGSDFDATQLGGPFTDGSIQAFANQYGGGGQLFPGIAPGSYATLGTGGVKLQHGFTDQYEIDVIKTRKNHQFKFGFMANLIQNGQTANATYAPEGYPGTYNWSGNWTCGPNPLLCDAHSGNPFADMMLGLVGSGSVTTAFPIYPTERQYGFYFNDTWHITPKLTLNLGLRWDLDYTGYDRYNNQQSFEPALQNPIGNEIGPNTGGQTLNQALGRTLLGSMITAGTPTANGQTRLGKVDPYAIGPRLGASWLFRPTTVIKGGWARVYNSSYGGGAVPAGTGIIGSTPFLGFTPVVTTTDGIHPIITPTNWYPNGFGLPTGHDSADLTSGVGYSSTIGPNMDRVPYMNQITFGFEQAFWGNSLLKVSYVGTQGGHLGSPMVLYGDQLPISTAAQYGNALFDTVPNPFYGIITGAGSALAEPTIQRGQLLHQWPQFNGITPFYGLNSKAVWPVFTQKYPFRSNFSGLLASFQKQFGGGSEILVSYTLSKNLTNADTAGWMQPTSVFGPQNQLDQSQEYSLSVIDVPQRLVISHVYMLPFGKGHDIGSKWNGWENAVAGGWGLAGVLTFSSGFPLPIANTPNNSGTGAGGNTRPNLLSQPHVTSGTLDQRLQVWVDPSAFAPPAPFTFGNAPRVLNGVRADGINNYDLSLFKDFNVWAERLKLQLRFDFYNIFNTPHFGEPNMLLGSGTFGQVTSTASPARYIQIALRLSW